MGWRSIIVEFISVAEVTNAKYLETQRDSVEIHELTPRNLTLDEFLV